MPRSNSSERRTQKLDETARLLKAADEELLALEAEELAVKVDLAEAPALAGALSAW
jgi:hypothetical protein